MSIKSIKIKAEELLKDCKPIIIRICIIIMLLTAIFNLLLEIVDSFVGILIVGIVFLTVEHGFVVSSLKVVKDQKDELSQDDAFVGFKRFKELFPTYCLSEFLKLFITILLALIMFLIALGTLPMSFADVMNAYTIDPIDTFFKYSSFFDSLILIVIVIFLFNMFISVYFFAVPYLLEEEHLTCKKAILESVKIMKGHVWQYLKLILSFIGWILLQGIFQVSIDEVLSFIPYVGVLSSLIGSLIGVYMYYPKFIVSKAILYEEIKLNKNLIETQNI